MCSRFDLKSSPDATQQHFAYSTPATFPPREKIAPTDPIMIIRNKTIDQREAVLVRWGFIPHWVKNPDDFPLIINARAETLLEKPSFRTSLAHKRGLLPATAFYEWSGPKGRRDMHKFHPPTEEPFALACLWDHWLGADGSEFESAAIITVAANKDIAPYHDRMPAYLTKDDYQAWLDVKNVSAKDALKLLKPAATGVFSPTTSKHKNNKKPKQQSAKNKNPDQGELF